MKEKELLPEADEVMSHHGGAVTSPPGGSEQSFPHPSGGRWAEQLGDGQPAKELSLAPEPRTLPAGSPAACVPERLAGQVRPGPPRPSGPASRSHLRGLMVGGPGRLPGEESIPASGGGRETPGPSTRPGPRLLRRAGQPEPGREREARPGSGFATCPGAPHPETQDLQTGNPGSILPDLSLATSKPNFGTPACPTQTRGLYFRQESRPQSSFLRPRVRPDFSLLLSPGVCHLVLVVLSLWPERAVAPGPPSGSPRVSSDPRADLDSAVLLTRSLLADTRQLAAHMRDKFPADGDHNLDSLPTLAMSAGTLGALQLPGVLTRLRVDLMSYLRHVQWLRRAGGSSLKTLEPELGALQARLDRLLRRLQLLTARLALPQAAPDQPSVPLGPPTSAWGSIRAAHAILGGLHLTLDWAVRGLLLLKTRL
ncbi:interleukin-11 [Phodopus roborovskii]|uniref:interleukin-11 n=1 Tax=Phodopus roborovskii TaxID=109678 RepID=UPI0021E42487|nr:interleukin-11 [Phodopus roborovskii]